MVFIILIKIQFRGFLGARGKRISCEMGAHVIVMCLEFKWVGHSIRFCGHVKLPEFMPWLAWRNMCVVEYYTKLEQQPERFAHFYSRKRITFQDSSAWGCFRPLVVFFLHSLQSMQRTSDAALLGSTTRCNRKWWSDEHLLHLIR